MKMIDIHTHLLPHIDDGSRDVDMSMKMLSESRRQGVELCVSTSHCRLHHADSIDSFLSRREKSFEEVKLNLTDSHPEILLGAEVYLDHDISRYPRVKELCFGKSDYMLMEFPHMQQDSRTTDWIYDLMMVGVKPIIAHVERYPQWKKLIAGMDGEDVRFQVNAEMFLSFRGRRFVDTLIKSGIDFIVSSDMHNTTSRVCNMKSACERAEKKYGAHTAERLFYKNADSVIQKVKEAEK